MREVDYKGVIVVQIKDEAFDDIEVFEMIVDLDGGNVFVLPTLCKRLFGSDKYKEIKEALRDEDGIVHASEMSEFFMHVLQNSGQKAKN